MLRVLGKASSINVRKVLWTCTEIGVPFVREDWGSGFRPTDAPEFVAINPNGMVPVLVDDDFVLWESNTICRYLAAKHGRTDLLPAEPRARAAVEQWMDWQATELNNSWRYAFMSIVRKSDQHQDRELLAAAIANWNRHMVIFEGQLQAAGPFVVGDSFSLADVVLGLSVNRWLMTPIGRPRCPAIDAFCERLSGRPGFLAFGRNGAP